MGHRFKKTERNVGREKKSEILFWIGFAFLFAKFLWQASLFAPEESFILQVMLFFGLLFLLLRILLLMSAYRRPAFAALGIFIALGSYFLSGETVLLTTILAVLAAAGIGCQRIFRFWCRAMLPVFTLMLLAYGLSCLLGVTGGGEFTSIGGFRDSRNALYFIHPNYCAAFFFAFAITYALRDDVSMASKIACYSMSLAVIYFITGSRTSTIALLSYPIFAVVLRVLFGKNKTKYAKRISVLLPLFPAALAVITYWIGAYWFTSPFFSQAFSDLLTGRPSLWWAQYNYAGLTLFGQQAFQGTIEVKTTIQTVQTVDGLYSSFLYNMGLAGFLYMLYLLFKWAQNAETVALERGSAALLSLFLFGFCEWHAINVFVCASLFLLSEAVGLKKEEGPSNQAGPRLGLNSEMMVSEMCK